MSKLKGIYKYILYVLVIYCIQIFLFKELRDDGLVHFNRIQSIAENIKTQGLVGQLQQKIYFSTVDNMGYAFPMFYGDLLLYPFALLEIVIRALGFNSQWVMGLYFTVMGVFSIVQFRHYLSKIYNKDAVKIVQLLYVTLPYFGYFIMRQAAGEMVAWVAYPGIFYGFSKILNMDEKDRFSWNGFITLTFWMQILVLNHLISAYIVCWALLIWSLFRIKEIFKVNKILQLAASAVMTVGICSYFLFPMIEQLSKKYLIISNTTNDLYDPVQLSIGNLFLPSWFFKIIEVTTGFKQDIIQANGFSPAYFGFLFLVVGQIIIKSKSRDSKKYIIMTIGLLFICTPLVRLTQPIFEKIQFPFRFLEILSFLVLVFLLKNWEKVNEANIKQIISVQLLSVALIALESNFVYADYTNVDREIDIQTQIGTGCEYLPYSKEYTESGVVSFKDKYDFDRWAYDVQKSDAFKVQTDIVKGGYLINRLENLDRDTNKIILPINYYYGYSAFDEKGNQLETNLGDYGLLEVTGVNPDCNELKVIYTGTKVQDATKVIYFIQSAIFIVILQARYVIDIKGRKFGGKYR